MVPCQRKTRTQGRNRRSHDAIKPKMATRCPNCGEAKLPHAACPDCGYVRPGLTLQLEKQE